MNSCKHRNRGGAGFALAAACMILAAMSARAGDVWPGVLFYGNTHDSAGNTWRTSIKSMATTEEAQTLDIGWPGVGGAGILPQHQTVPKGGAFHHDIQSQGFGVVQAPSSGEAVTLLEFNSATLYRALICRRITFRYDAPANDRVRYGGLHGHMAITTYADATAPVGQLSAFVYDSKGDADPVDVFYIPTQPGSVTQTGYAGLPNGEAYSLQVVSGCLFANFPQCTANSLAYALVTNDDGALGASIEPTFGQNIGTEPGAAALSLTEFLAEVRRGPPDKVPAAPQRK